MRIPIRTESGWQIDAILETTYVATKEGESVTLEADTLEQMELLIALREGSVKPCPLWVAGHGCGEKILPPEDTVAIVEAWAKEHPEERSE